jgi:large subunit ribosomal protein L15
MPLQRRLPKRGFKNLFRKEIAIINVKQLEIFENDTVVDVAALINSGLVKKKLNGVKVLGNGDLTKKLTVRVQAISASAREKIEKAGGVFEKADD